VGKRAALQQFIHPKDIDMKSADVRAKIAMSIITGYTFRDGN